MLRRSPHFTVSALTSFYCNNFHSLLSTNCIHNIFYAWSGLISHKEVHACRIYLQIEDEDIEEDVPLEKRKKMFTKERKSDYKIFYNKFTHILFT